MLRYYSPNKLRGDSGNKQIFSKQQRLKRSKAVVHFSSYVDGKIWITYFNTRYEIGVHYILLK